MKPHSRYKSYRDESGDFLVDNLCDSRTLRTSKLGLLAAVDIFRGHEKPAMGLVLSEHLRRRAARVKKNRQQVTEGNRNASKLSTAHAEEADAIKHTRDDAHSQVSDTTITNSLSKKNSPVKSTRKLRSGTGVERSIPSTRGKVEERLVSNRNSTMSRVKPSKIQPQYVRKGWVLIIRNPEHIDRNEYEKIP